MEWGAIERLDVYVRGCNDSRLVLTIERGEDGAMRLRPGVKFETVSSGEVYDEVAEYGSFDVRGPDEAVGAQAWDLGDDEGLYGCEDTWCATTYEGLCPQDNAYASASNGDAFDPYDASRADNAREEYYRLMDKSRKEREREQAKKREACEEAIRRLMDQGLTFSSYEVAAQADTTARIASGVLVRLARQGVVERYMQDGQRRYRAPSD